MGRRPTSRPVASILVCSRGRIVRFNKFLVAYNTASCNKRELLDFNSFWAIKIIKCNHILLNEESYYTINRNTCLVCPQTTNHV